MTGGGCSSGRVMIAKPPRDKEDGHGRKAIPGGATEWRG